MGVKTFAAISVGSYEISMKIYEFSGKERMKQIDYIRHSIELGTDTYATGKLSFERVEELCRVLREFQKICKSYQVDSYKAYGTSAIREMENREVILEQIKARTGIRIDVLSNSEQRFMDYKSLAAMGDTFYEVIKFGTAVVDIGGGSIQISLFDKEKLITTQNLKIGILRMREKLNEMNLNSRRFEDVAEELIGSQLGMFQKYFLQERKIENLVVVDDYISELVGKMEDGFHVKKSMTCEMFQEYFHEFQNRTHGEIVERFQLDEDRIQLLYLSSLLVKNMMETFGIHQLRIPCVTLSDGIAYEYGEKRKLLCMQHDFNQDIIACAKNISERYKGSKKQAETISRIALSMFDTMRKVHGLGGREKLLLQIAVILHDCGKYINLANDAECSYSIIMSTEIIGLSHAEREIVANIVRYSQHEIKTYAQMNRENNLQMRHYLTIAKCSAILQVARGLARSHKQKYKQVQTRLVEDTLEISLYSASDISLEVGYLSDRIHFFEEVYSIKPEIHVELIRGK